MERAFAWATIVSTTVGLVLGITSSIVGVESCMVTGISMLGLLAGCALLRFSK
jgi:hypothetical protein